MKALPFKIPPREGAAFRVQIDELPHFYDRFHHHPEIQITWIVQSSGTLLLGTTVTDFKSGDVFMIGAQVPHRFKNHPSDKEENNQASSVSIFFNEDSLGKGFFELPELKEVKRLLLKANHGVRIEGATRQQVIEKIKLICAQKGFPRLLHFLSVLHQLATSAEASLISRMPFDLESGIAENEKLEKVVQFVLEHYDRKVKLEEVAAVANLSVSAFCRFFKLRTRKTFTQFLNEFRISMAGKLLTDQEQSITEISYAVGFSNLSNFNRQFKEATGFTPSQYIKKYAND